MTSTLLPLSSIILAVICVIIYFTLKLSIENSIFDRNLVVQKTLREFFVQNKIDDKSNSFDLYSKNELVIHCIIIIYRASKVSRIFKEFDREGAEDLKLEAIRAIRAIGMFISKSSLENWKKQEIFDAVFHSARDYQLQDIIKDLLNEKRHRDKERKALTDKANKLGANPNA